VFSFPGYAYLIEESVIVFPLPPLPSFLLTITRAQVAPPTSLLLALPWHAEEQVPVPYAMAASGSGADGPPLSMAILLPWIDGWELELPWALPPSPAMGCFFSLCRCHRMSLLLQLP
jgi:hypothetical protein